MRKARLTEHPIIAILKSVEAGRTVKDVCRETGISETSYYNREAGVPFPAVSHYILLLFPKSADQH